MKDTKEFVLFFKESANYVPIDVAKEILSRYKELGDPIILPEDSKENLPLILFKENEDFQLQANYRSVNIIVKQKYFDQLASIIFDIVDTFEEFKGSFKRVGYISNIFLSPSSVARAQKRFLNMDHLEDIEDFSLNWYKKLETKVGVINVWERFITDKDHFTDLLCQYDFNSLSEEEITLNMKYIKEFIAKAESYMEERTDF